MKIKEASQVLARRKNWKSSHQYESGTETLDDGSGDGGGDNANGGRGDGGGRGHGGGWRW